MADSGETIRSLLSGFNQMQYNLGLLPTQSGQQPMGVQLNPAPPPPPVMHPSDFGQMQMAQHQAVAQQTYQLALQSRSAPPPSMSAPSPFTWGNTMAGIGAGQFNPYVAGALGANGGGGGGMASASYMTAPQFGMYRPGGGSPMGQPGGMPSRMPSIFNPMAPGMPAPHFATPAMHQLQMMQGAQAQGAGMIAGMMQTGMGIGGSMIGSALGSFLGPMGTMAGGYLGGMAGDALGNLSMGPALRDMQRGRQIQNMTAPFMASGAHFNPFTGQGMDRAGAVETARGLRTMSRDYDFQRTGFNQADVMKLTQLAGDQGLLQASQNPDDITRKMKDISKAVKALVQITGDPDVRSAIASLGQMKQLGFEGIAGQTGAVANRATFARMAGMSQSAMNEHGMAGAMMAQQVGLAGSTGYAAGMAGAGMGNVAISSGSFSDLQLARAGGRGGLAQTNAMATLGAANQDVFMAAALRKGKDGKISVDMDAYNANHKLGLNQVAQLASQNMHGLGQEGIFALSSQRQELKDKIAQSNTPIDNQLNALYQARALQKEVPGMSLGAAFKHMGLSESEARTMELQYKNPEFFKGLNQQLGVQRRDASDRERARREQSRTPGLLTNAGRRIREGLGDASDGINDIGAGLMERMSRVEEDRMEQRRGGYVRRYNESDLVRTDSDRSLAYSGLMGGDFSRMARPTGAGAFNESGGSRAANWLGEAAGMTSASAANQTVAAANRGGGMLFGFIPNRYKGLDEARADVAGYSTVSRMAASGRGAGVASGGTLSKLQAALGGSKPGFNAANAVTQAVNHLRLEKSGKASLGGAMSATGLSPDEVRTAAIKGLVYSGLSQKEAEAAWSEHGDSLGAEIMGGIDRSGDRGLIERKNVSIEQSSQAKGADVKADREGIERQLSGNFRDLGLGGTGLTDRHDLNSHTIESIKNLSKNTDSRTLAYAAATAAKNTDEMKRIEASFGTSESGMKAVRAMQTQASSLFSSQDKKTQAALTTAGAQKNVSGRFAELKTSVGVDIARHALDKASASIGAAVGDSGIGESRDIDDLLGRVSGVSDEALGKVGGGTGKALARYRAAAQKGDQKGMAAAREALGKAIVGGGPGATSETHGGTSGGSEDESLVKRQEELSELESEARKDFAEGAKDLKEAARLMRGAQEDNYFNFNMPKAPTP